MPTQAADLVKFLTSPASEAAIFKQTGNLPSQPALLKSTAVQNFKNPFFSNAPVGQIFATSALRLKPQIIGPHQGDIQTASSNAIQRVEQKKQSPAQVLVAVPQGRQGAVARSAGRAGPTPLSRPGTPRLAQEDDGSDMSDRAAAAPTPVARRRSATRRRLRRVDAKVSPYLYIAPFFILFAIFGLFPLCYTAWVSLTDRNLLNPTCALHRARTTTPSSSTTRTSGTRSRTRSGSGCSRRSRSSCSRS